MDDLIRELNRIHYVGDTDRITIYFHRMGIGSETPGLANATTSLAAIEQNGGELIYAVQIKLDECWG